MTVADLIVALQSLPQNYEVVHRFHSEYDVLTTVGTMEGLDKGGYISEAYDERDKRRAHGYVVVG